MRVLFAVMSPLDPHLGAPQMALNLAAALRSEGVVAEVWSPHPVPSEVPWWRRMAWMRRAIVEHVERCGPFDVVDVPAIGVSRALARRSVVVARNIQPDLHYFWAELRYAGRLRRVAPHRQALNALFDSYLSALVVAGWFRARRILCLGGLDHAWMCRRFPWWRGKLGMYPNAIDDDERARLAAVRRGRKPPAGGGIRYLWLGRWAAHKGNDVLVRFVSRHLADHPRDRITIAGCGAQARSHIPRELLDAGRVQLVESYSRGELPALLASHDAGLFTSRVEGWGLTLQEMLESGMPVHATDAGAAHDLRHDFPRQLRAFPPEPSQSSWEIDDPPPEYFSRCSWPAIAAGWLAHVRDAIGR